VSPKPLSTVFKAAAFSLGLLLQLPAQAGLISGSWDPVFGPALPGMSWSAYAELSASDTCTGTSGNQTVAAGQDCAGAKVLAVFLQLYNAPATALDWSQSASYSSNPPNSATFAVCDASVSGNAAYTSRCNGNFSTYFNLSALRIEGGSVVGLQTGVATTFLAQDPAIGNNDPWPSSSLGNRFTLNFTLNGPELVCVHCQTADGDDDDDIQSSTEGLRQFLVTYTDSGAPKFTDGDGKALGVVLDETGKVLGQATSIDALRVPEPAGLALVLTALGAAALVRRRR
jgi:hypothetical protein